MDAKIDEKLIVCDSVCESVCEPPDFELQLQHVEYSGEFMGRFLEDLGVGFGHKIDQKSIGSQTSIFAGSP